MKFCSDFNRLIFSVKQTVACCKNVLKDYWKSLRVDLMDKSEIWIEEAKRKQLVKILYTLYSSKRILDFWREKLFVMFRALLTLCTNDNRPVQYDLTPTLVIKRTEEESKKIEQDIKRAIELAPHKKPLERG